MSWTLSASGSIPPAAPDGTPVDVVTLEMELYEAARAVLSDPKYGTAASSFGGSHVSGSLHVADS